MLWAIVAYAWARVSRFGIGVFGRKKHWQRAPHLVCFGMVSYIWLSFVFVLVLIFLCRVSCSATLLLPTASRLVQAMSAWLKARRPSSRHSRDARVYGHATTAMHKLSTPHPTPSLPSAPPFPPCPPSPHLSTPRARFPPLRFVFVTPALRAAGFPVVKQAFSMPMNMLMTFVTEEQGRMDKWVFISVDFLFPVSVPCTGELSSSASFSVYLVFFPSSFYKFFVLFPFCAPRIFFIYIIVTTSAVSSTNLGSILIFASCVLLYIDRPFLVSLINQNLIPGIRYHCIMLPIMHSQSTYR